MISLRRINRQHILVLDTSTDCSHCVPTDDTRAIRFTFNASGDGYAPDGKYVVRLRLRETEQTGVYAWQIKHDFPFELPEYPEKGGEGIFDAETAFLKQWLALQTQPMAAP